MVRRGGVADRGAEPHHDVDQDAGLDADAERGLAVARRLHAGAGVADGLALLAEEEPRERRKAMLHALAEAMDDGSAVSLEQLRDELDGYSGRLVLRIPRSLHRALKDAAKVEGVSLNQYMLYKLSR